MESEGIFYLLLLYMKVSLKDLLLVYCKLIPSEICNEEGLKSDKLPLCSFFSDCRIWESSYVLRGVEPLKGPQEAPNSG